MKRRILALWHTNLKKLEYNQKVLDYCTCNKRRKVRQHWIKDFCAPYIFVKCCNCGLESVNLDTEKYIKRYYTKEQFDKYFYFDEILKRYISVSHKSILVEYKEKLLKHKV